MASRDSLTNFAYDYIKQRIVSREYKSGDPIAEESISQKLNISRTPVRKALQMLEEEGFICHIPYAGAVVARISEEDLKEICSLRLFLECWALEKSIKLISDEDLDQAEENFANAATSNDWEVHHNADRFLHELIVSNCNSRRISFIANLLNSQLDWYRNTSEEVTVGGISRREHIAIINAIRERDLKKAKEALTYHLNNVERRFLSAY